MGRKEHRRNMTNRSKYVNNKEMHIKSVQMSVQLQFNKWSNFAQTDFNWKFRWAVLPKLVSFFDKLYIRLSPSNLKR